jgi:hypothetical protein
VSNKEAILVIARGIRGDKVRTAICSDCGREFVTTIFADRDTFVENARRCLECILALMMEKTKRES